ncbi:MAG: hypothetical protein KA069_02465 [Candidatus Saccharimonas sp.]|nr:hypothetical protein [Candidatus Saccharimonas sp.]
MEEIKALLETANSQAQALSAIHTDLREMRHRIDVLEALSTEIKCIPGYDHSLSPADNMRRGLQALNDTPPPQIQNPLDILDKSVTETEHTLTTLASIRSDISDFGLAQRVEFEDLLESGQTFVDALSSFAAALHRSADDL